LLLICDLFAMEELIRTNDPVLISFAESLLKDAGLRAFVADGHMSILEGSAGFIMRRILVDSDDFEEARGLMRDAGLGHELRQP
jgi:Putative prokaryotic signal transducing protein